MSTTITKLKKIINNVTTEVLKGLTVNTTAVFQEMNISCDKIVYDEAVRLCKIKKELYKQYNIPFNSKLIPECMACSASDVHQNATIVVNSSDVENNAISNGIQSGLSNKLNDEVVFLNTQGNNDKATSMTVIRDIVKNNFNTKLINETIKNFTFEQTMDMRNLQVNKINQILVVNVIADTLINDLIDTNSEFNNAVEILDGVPVKEEEKKPEEVKKESYINIYIFIFICVICYILYNSLSKDKKHKVRRFRRYN